MDNLPWDYYQVLEFAGKGSHGIVYKALDTRDDSTVAIKKVLPEHVDDEKLLTRLEIEIDILKKLSHPNIVSLREYTRDEQGVWMVMNWLGGGNLRALLNKTGALPLKRVAELLDDIADALTVAHQRKIVHRDLKPENIMLDAAGKPCITDFSIAKRLEYNSITTTGTVLGSARYLSPEQILSEAITPQTDICALGILLYEMLAGEYPFMDVNTELQLILRLAQAVLPPLYPEYPQAIDQVIQKATAKDPEKRYESVKAFAAAFRHAAGL